MAVLCKTSEREVLISILREEETEHSTWTATRVPNKPNTLFIFRIIIEV